MKTTTKSSTLTISICIVITALSVAFAIGERTNAQMDVYAAQNDCEWVYQGTWYGDDRDYICK